MSLRSNAVMRDKLAVKLLFFSLMALCTISLSVCNMEDEEVLKYVEPPTPTPPRTCDEAMELLLDECNQILIGTDGIALSLEEAALGCKICEAGNAYYEPYCCIRACRDENSSCDANRKHEGMIACAANCVTVTEPLFNKDN